MKYLLRGLLVALTVASPFLIALGLSTALLWPVQGESFRLTAWYVVQAVLTGLVVGLAWSRELHHAEMELVAEEHARELALRSMVAADVEKAFRGLEQIGCGVQPPHGGTGQPSRN